MASKWELVEEAFRTWKKLVDARRRTKQTEAPERKRRLVTLTAAAWRRYERRWRAAKSSQ